VAGSTAIVPVRNGFCAGHDEMDNGSPYEAGDESRKNSGVATVFRHRRAALAAGRGLKV
jgi:hypothetical protein